MSFWLLGAAVVLAVHAIATSLASLLVAHRHRGARQALAGLPPAERASRLLRAALFPFAAGLACVALVVPAWLIYEPRDTQETSGLALVMLAAAGLALIVGRVGGGVRDALRTRRVVQFFRREGLELAGLPAPASRAAYGFPVAALAGLWRPRLLLAESVLGALQREELDAVVAHELAHAKACDNLKRLLLRFSPDPLALTSLGRSLRAEFVEAAEAAADADACARVEPTVLARAILKVARLVPPSGRLDLVLASLHHEDSGGLAARIRALVETPPSAPGRPTPTERRAGSRGRLAIGLLIATGLAGALAALAVVHQGLEGLVQLL
jgi:Zn-dependent protease with chaperone function